jgi:hypothetical protein
MKKRRLNRSCDGVKTMIPFKLLAKTDQKVGIILRIVLKTVIM